MGARDDRKEAYMRSVADSQMSFNAGYRAGIEAAAKVCREMALKQVYMGELTDAGVNYEECEAEIEELKDEAGGKG